jgi:beta-barrel assembly-enhancing protease
MLIGLPLRVQKINRTEYKLKQFIFFTFLISLLVLSCSSDPQVVVKKQMEERVAQEKQVGRTLAARLTTKYSLVKSKEAEEAMKYLFLLGNSIGSTSSRPELTFQFGILDDDNVNAFSCPGGYILISKGALRAIDNEAELAYVLAHEISHAVLSHSIKIEQKGGFVEFIANFLSGGGGLVNLAIKQASAEMEKMLLEKGREKELEYDADQAGIVYSAVTMGYDYRSAVNFLKRLEADTVNTKTLVNTHPPYSERIDRIIQFSKQQGLPQSGKINKGRYTRYIKPMLDSAPAKKDA